MKIKIGISGGTFDPIHTGHLIVAEEIRTAYQLDRILFIPAGKPPHKDFKHITPAKCRYEMVKKAIEDNPYFQISDMEIIREGFTYTIDTVRSLYEQSNKTDYSNKPVLINEHRLYFITGADTIFEIESWKAFEELFTLVDFIVAVRPGYDIDSLEEEAEYLRLKYKASISIFRMPLIGISSTDIRDRVRMGQSIRYLVPRNVEEYIYENSLYKG